MPEFPVNEAEAMVLRERVEEAQRHAQRVCSTLRFIFCCLFCELTLLACVFCRNCANLPTLEGVGNAAGVATTTTTETLLMRPLSDTGQVVADAVVVVVVVVAGEGGVVVVVDVAAAGVDAAEVDDCTTCFMFTCLEQ